MVNSRLKANRWGVRGGAIKYAIEVWILWNGQSTDPTYSTYPAHRCLCPRLYKGNVLYTIVCCHGNGDCDWRVWSVYCCTHSLILSLIVYSYNWGNMYADCTTWQNVPRCIHNVYNYIIQYIYNMTIYTSVYIICIIVYTIVYTTVYNRNLRSEVK